VRSVACATEGLSTSRHTRLQPGAEIEVPEAVDRGCGPVGDDCGEDDIPLWEITQACRTKG